MTLLGVLGAPDWAYGETANASPPHAKDSGVRFESSVSAERGASSVLGPGTDEPYDLLPAHPVHVVQVATDCLTITDPERAEQRRSCMAALVPLVERGMRFQQCIWDTNDVHAHGLCPKTRQPSTVAPVALAVRLQLIEQAEHVIELLKLAAQGIEDAPLTRSILSSFWQSAASAVMQGHGGYTLIAQGGVSLGSWQSGYAYIVTEVLKARNRRRNKIGSGAYRTVTGASAGSVNALAFGLEGCSRDFAAPSSTLAFRIWIDRLRLFSSGNQHGLLSASGGPSSLAIFDDAPVRDAMNDASQYMDIASKYVDCHFGLGFVATHLGKAESPVHVMLNAHGSPENHIVSPRLTERFAVQVDFNPDAKVLSNLLPPDSTGLAAKTAVPDKAFYAQLGTTEHPTRRDLLRGIRASGAFPIAFPPVELDYRTYDTSTSDFIHKTGIFIDGGVLDNTPIGLAIEMNHWNRTRPANPWFFDLVADPNTYIFVNPGLRAWSYARPSNVIVAVPDPVKRNARATSPIGTYVNWFEDLLATGADAQLVHTAEQNSFVRQEGGANQLPRLVVPQRYLPIAGEQLGHFFAFLDRDLRVFDFVVGMADARVHLGSLEGVDREDIENVMTALTQAGTADSTAKKFQCMWDFYDKVVLPVGRDAPRDDKFARPAPCADVDAPFFSLLKASWSQRAWTQDPAAFSETDTFAHYLSALRQAKYAFREPPEPYRSSLNAADANLFLRYLAEEGSNRLAAKETGAMSVAINVGGRIAADAATVRLFPKYIWSIGYADRGFEIGGSLGMTAPSEYFALRANVFGRLYQLRTTDIALNDSANMMDTNLGMGMSAIFSPRWWLLTPGVLDLELGLGGVWVSRYAPWQANRRSVNNRVGGYMSIAAVLAQRVYFLVEYQRFLDTWLSDAYVGTIQAQMPNWHLGASFGLRFF